MLVSLLSQREVFEYICTWSTRRIHENQDSIALCLLHAFFQKYSLIIIIPRCYNTTDYR